MSIATIVSFGFGSYGSINSAVILGYSNATAPKTVIDTHDLVKKWKKYYKEQKNALALKEAEKLEYARTLRDQLRGIEEDKETIIADSPDIVPFKPDFIFNNHEEMRLELHLLENELQILNIEMDKNAKLLRQEEDIEVILLTIH